MKRNMLAKYAPGLLSHIQVPVKSPKLWLSRRSRTSVVSVVSVSTAKKAHSPSPRSGFPLLGAPLRQQSLTLES